MTGLDKYSHTYNAGGGLMFRKSWSGSYNSPADEPQGEYEAKVVAGNSYAEQTARPSPTRPLKKYSRSASIPGEHAQSPAARRQYKQNAPRNDHAMSLNP